MKQRAKLLALLSVCLAAAVPVLSAGAAGAADAEWNAASGEVSLTESVEVGERYMLGDVLSIPENSLTVGDTEYPAVGILHSPSGIARTGDSVVLDETGVYTLEYTAVADGRSYSAETEFLVCDELYSVSGRNSSAEWAHLDYARGREGIVARVVNGDRFEYNGVIDLTGKTKDDSLITLCVLPEVLGTADAANFAFTFTDVYDPNNYVTVTTKKVVPADEGAWWAQCNSYVTANAAGQVPTGIELNGSGETLWEGNRYLLHRNDRFGACVRFSMPGTPSYDENDPTGSIVESDIGAETMQISFDYEERRVYVNGTIVIDLDDPMFFSDVRWDGFTTGECYLTISATQYNAYSMNLLITDVDGNSDFEENVLTDETAPEITVESEGLPDAIVGRPYVIPEASAYDAFDRGGEVTAKVYHEYGTMRQARIQVTDGAFIPYEEGDYTVVYSSTDRSGNTATERFDVMAYSDVKEISISLGEHTAEGVVGQPVTVADYTLSDASGETSVEVTAVSGDRVYEIENGRFVPLYAGTYTITYEYSDYINAKTETYTVEVSPDGDPILPEEADVPKYVIRGAGYAVPQLYGYVFENGGPKDAAAEVYLSDDGGSERKLTAAKFFSYADEYCTLVYRLGEAEKSYRIPVVDVGYGMTMDLSGYFYGDFTPTNNDASITYADNGGDGVLEFINPVQVFDFYFRFSVPQALNEFGSVAVYLTDVSDPEIGLKFEYIKGRAGSSTFRLNDGTAYTLTSDFFGSGYFEASYDAEAGTVAPSGAFSVEVTTDSNGNEWKGFPSSKAYLRIELKEVSGDAGIEISRVNNQPFSKIVNDIIAPEISMTTARGYRNVGDIVTIAATYAEDVLDPDITFSMYVRTPDDTMAVAVDGTVLDSTADPTKAYQLELTQYGRYEVYYEAEDTNGRQSIYSYLITVADIVAPEVEFVDPVTEASVGDDVPFAETKITDNLSEEFTVVRYVEMPDGKRVIAEDCDAFIPQVAGRYRVWYYVSDGAGNVAIAGYTVNVTE